MTPEMLKWAIGVMGTLTVTIVGAVAWLATLVFRVGLKYGAVESKLDAVERVTEKLDRANERLDRIPLIESKLESLADAQAEERRRFASEWPEMRDKVTSLWERVFSLQNWRKSQGQYGNGE